MAKPLGDKSKVIREALGKHPDVGNTDLAEKLNNAQDRLDDKLSFTAQDVAAQKLALKKLGAAPATKASPAAEPAPKAARTSAPGKKPGRQPAPAPAAPPAPAPAAPAPVQDVAGHVEAIRAAVKNLGVDQVKRLVGLFE